MSPEVSKPQVARAQLHYSRETRLEMAREERDWMRSVWPGDSDWSLVHIQPEREFRVER